MRWQGRRGSENVEDRRSAGGRLGGLGSGGGGRRGCSLQGGVGIVVVAIIIWLMGGNPLQVLQMIGGDSSFSTPEYTQTSAPSTEEDDLARFASVVLADTEEVWSATFKQMGLTYRKPTLVLFSGYTSSPCGAAQSSTGPFYCSLDEKIYLDLSFFKQMETQLRAGGDFAYAYVIAHEVGHHVQKLLGTLEQVHEQMGNSNKKRANALSVKLELQADFYAGYWAHHTQKMFNSLDADDIEEALNAANAIGDDRLQEQAQGYSVPDSFTHGTSKERHDWFYKGYRTGDFRQGNTFQ